MRPLYLTIFIAIIVCDTFIGASNAGNYSNSPQEAVIKAVSVQYQTGIDRAKSFVQNVKGGSKLLVFTQYYVHANYQAAISAEAICVQENHTLEAVLYQYLGECQLQLGQQDLARMNFEAAFKSNYNRQEAYWELLNIARRESDSQHVKEYEDKLQEIAVINISRQPKPLTAKDLTSGTKPASADDLTKTLIYSQGIYDDLEKSQGQSLLDIADIEEKSGRLEQALNRFDDALRVYEINIDSQIGLADRFKPKFASAYLYECAATAAIGKVRILRKLNSKDVKDPELEAIHWALKSIIVDSPP